MTVGAMTLSWVNWMNATTGMVHGKKYRFHIQTISNSVYYCFSVVEPPQDFPSNPATRMNLRDVDVRTLEHDNTLTFYFDSKKPIWVRGRSMMESVTLFRNEVRY